MKGIKIRLGAFLYYQGKKAEKTVGFQPYTLDYMKGKSEAQCVPRSLYKPKSPLCSGDKLISMDSAESRPEAIVNYCELTDQAKTEAAGAFSCAFGRNRK